jgi:hypothetical protein
VGTLFPVVAHLANEAKALPGPEPGARRVHGGYSTVEPSRADVSLTSGAGGI